MTDLMIDYDDMHDSVAKMARIEQDLNSTEEFAAQTAEIIGHPALASTILIFAGRWNSKRNDMIEALGLVKESLDEIATTFDDLDRELAANLGG